MTVLDKISACLNPTALHNDVPIMRPSSLRWRIQHTTLKGNLW
jgi:hypothetical protein